MQETISSNFNQPVVKKSNKKVIIVVVVVILALAVGVFFFLRKPQVPVEPEITVTETQEPTPTEKPEINKESVRIQVLNGTGTPGQAGTAVDALTEAGYNADNIKASNAEDYDHTSTTVAFREGFEEVAVDIQKALESNFDNIEVDSTKVSEDSEFDIIVTTGGKKFEAATPTLKPSVSPTGPTKTPTPSPTLSPTPTP